ncbi:hypothetical protein D5S17_01375 [Pseudonocardiaceae bacterium YIM PH 21723]|nr:hypothetical protein D5S17_01375 [Pseudonocardiaceae bacterium YIM PH 21723]
MNRITRTALFALAAPVALAFTLAGTASAQAGSNDGLDLHLGGHNSGAQVQLNEDHSNVHLGGHHSGINLNLNNDDENSGLELSVGGEHSGLHLNLNGDYDNHRGCGLLGGLLNFGDRYCGCDDGGLLN